jgi:uncharacterized protein (UPF0333 family)
MNITLKMKKKKAQQLIEFLLVVPFMMIILGILIEYAYALNINMTLSQGLKTATVSIYANIKPSMTENDIKTLVKNNLETYLSSNNAPVNSENNLTVGCTTIGETAVFMASYTYVPAFTLPNVYFKIMPDEFHFFATSAVPAMFLGENNYDSSLDSLTLDKIWTNTSSFASLDSFKDSKKGIMADTATTAERNSIIFLIPTTAPGLTKAYVLVDWNGVIQLTPTSDKYILNTTDGKIYECSTSACIDNNKKFFDYITIDKKYNNVIFIHDDEIPSNLNNLFIYWLDPIGSTDLSDTSVNGILKRNLALIDTGSLSVGNYDNIDISTYSGDISSGNTYKTETFGSMVFVYNSSEDDISKIILGESAPSYVYDFGSKVN